MASSSFRRLWTVVEKVVSRHPRRTKRRVVFRLQVTPLEDRIAPAVVDHFVFTTQPPASATAGNGFGVVVKAENASNKVDTGFTGKVTLADFYETPGGTLAKNAIGGVATFTGLTFKQARSYEYLYASATNVTSGYSNGFAVTAAAATKLADAGPAGNVVANANFTHTFDAVDPYGNTDPNFSGNVSVVLGNNPSNSALGGTLSIPALNGVASFTDLTLDKLGAGYTLQASATGLTGISSAAFNATDQIAFTAQPPSQVTAGNAFGLTVQVQDGKGNVDTNFNGMVSVTDYYGATIGGTPSAQAANGVAVFSGLSITSAGSHQMVVSASGVVNGSSNFFTVNGGTATHLTVYYAPPSTISPSNSPFTMEVVGRDGYENADPNFTGSISLNLSTNPTGATLGGTTTLSASGGYAYFSGLTIDRPGAGYVIQATGNGVTAITTSSLTVQDQMYVDTAPPSQALAGTPFNVVIGVGTANKLPDVNYSGTIKLTPDNFSGGTVDTFVGPLSAKAVNGVATFSNLSLTEPGWYGFIMDGDGLTQLPVLFHVVGAQATHLAITAQPPITATGGAPFGFSVSALDQYGNVDSNFYGQVSTSIHDNPGNAAVGGTQSVFASAGVATFYNLTLSKTGSGYTFDSTSSGLGTVKTNGVHVIPPGTAGGFAISSQPPFGVAAGAGFKFVVKAVDGFGTLDKSFTGPVTLSVNNGGSLSGAVSVHASGGVATFTGVSMTAPGSYNLTASSPTLGAITSAGVTITSGTAAKIVVSPTSDPVLAGKSFQVTATVEDKYGNVATNYYGYLTMALATNPGKATLGETSAYASAGVANYTFESISKAGTGYSLRASTSKFSGTSSLLNVTTDELVVTAQPGGSPTVNQGFGFAVSAENGSGVVDSSFTGAVTVSLINLGTGNPVLGGQAMVNAAAGVATFTGLTVNQPGAYLLSVSTSGIPGATTNEVDVAAAAATQLKVVTQPPAETTSSTGFGFVVEARDPNGFLDTGFNGNVTVTIANNPANGALGGTVTVPAVHGVATFSGLTIDKPGAPYTLQASATSLTADTTTGINVTSVGIATQLVVTTDPPTSMAAGDPFGFVVKAEDGSGNVDTTFNGMVTAGVVGDTASLSGSLTVQAKNGVATFTGLSITHPGFDALSATTTGLPEADTDIFTVAAGIAKHLTVTATPGGQVLGVPFGVSVSAVDDFGNVDRTFIGDVTIALGANPSGATLGGTLTATAVNGVAMFAGLSIDKAGSGFTLVGTASGLSQWTSAPFDVTSGQLAVTTQPAGTVAAGAGFGVSVQVDDSTGMLEKTFTGNAIAVLNGNDFTSGTLGGPVAVSISGGKASFANLSVNTPGDYWLTIVGNGVTSIDTGLFTVTGAKATKLAITGAPPGTVTAGAGFGLTVTAEDALGNADPSFNGKVTLAFGTNAGGGTLGGGFTATAVNGVATFSGVTISAPGTGDTLKATATGVTAGTTGSINVTAAGAASQLVVTTEPNTLTAGDSFSFVVKAEDSSGTVDTNFTGTVVLSVNSGATLGGQVSVPASSGVATFSNMSLTQAGGFMLTATSGALAPAVSDNITVNGKAASQLIVSDVNGALVNGPFALSVFAVDNYGNIDFNYNGDLTVSLGTNPTSANLGGTKTMTASGGIASYSDLTVDKAGAGYKLHATGSGLTANDSSAFTVTADGLVVTTSPPFAVLTGRPFGMTVSAEDTGGNVDTSFHGDVTLTPSGSSLGGKITVTAANGVASFTGLTLGQAGVYSITAAATGVTLGYSSAINVTGAPPAQKAPTFTSATSDSFLFGAAETFTVKTAGYPLAQISYTGNLPAGVTLVDHGDGTATIGGTPTESGLFSINIKATNSISPDAKQAFALTVNKTPSITSGNSTTFVVNQDGPPFTITTADGFPTGTTVSISAGKLPAGLSLSVDSKAGTGTIHGKPLPGDGGQYPLTLKATNASGLFTTLPFTLTINESPSFVSAGSGAFALNLFNSFPITTKGYPPASIGFTGTPPAGMQIFDNGNGTGFLKGTPTQAGSNSFTIKASNGIGQDASQTFNYTVALAPAITTGNSVTFNANVTATPFTVNTTPGNPSATTLKVLGTLPSGVTFTDNKNGTATIKGKPAVKTGGVYNLTIVASNASGVQTTQAFTLQVKEAPLFTTPATATFTVGQSVTIKVKTSGYPLVALTLTGGVLPGGMTFVDNLDGTATLSGTPVAGTQGNYTLVFKASNGLVPDATQQFKLVIK